MFDQILIKKVLLEDKVVLMKQFSIDKSFNVLESNALANRVHLHISVKF